MQKKCTVCGKVFESHYGTEVCSETCRIERKHLYDTNSNTRRKNHESSIPVIKICPICGKKFETFRNKYCSKECAGVAKKKNLHLYNRYYYQKKKGIKIMTSDMVLNNLRQLVGKKFDEDDIICAFEDYKIDGDSSIYVGDSDNIGYDKIAYIEEDTVQFLFELNSENIIEDVWME